MMVVGGGGGHGVYQLFFVLASRSPMSRSLSKESVQNVKKIPIVSKWLI
jgi:hypothetical protein